jgi:hypothetical protein
MKKIYQKGITLYLTIVILAIILSIVLGLSSIVVNQIKITSGMGNSVISFYAAETGAERVLQVIYSGGTPSASYLSRAGEFFSNDVSYEVDVLISGASGCAASNYCIRSSGSFKGTKRAVELKM